MYRVWLIAAVLASLGCGIATAKTIGAEKSIPDGMIASHTIASHTMDRLRVRAAETKPSLPTVTLVDAPDASPATNTFTAGDREGKIDEDRRRSPKRHAARFVHARAFETPMPEPVALLLLGTALFGASGLCVYRAARMRRNVVAIAMSWPG